MTDERCRSVNRHHVTFFSCVFLSARLRPQAAERRSRRGFDAEAAWSRARERGAEKTTGRVGGPAKGQGSGVEGLQQSITVCIYPFKG